MGPDGVSVPGDLGSVLWFWESDASFGRLPVGWATYSPLNLRAAQRAGGGGSQLCAKVFEKDWTYCPIARLGARTYDSLPRLKRESGKEVPPLDSSCPQMDAVLSSIQTKQNYTGASYVHLDMQVSSVEELRDEARKSQAEQSEAEQTAVATCPTGKCLAFRER